MGIAVVGTLPPERELAVALANDGWVLASETAAGGFEAELGHAVEDEEQLNGALAAFKGEEELVLGGD
jgi:hypothetical protein